MKAATDVTPATLRTIPLPTPSPHGDKEERGRVLVIAGSARNPGGAILAAIAALRAGAGKLQIATDITVATHVGVTVPEALVVSLRTSLSASEQSGLMDQAACCDAVLLGPGMERQLAAELVEPLLESSAPSSIVLDAAALLDLRPRADLLRRNGDRIVLTPHAGEMAALMDCSREEVASNPLRAAKQACQQFGATVALKGSTTWIVNTQGQAWRHEGGTVGLATSGSGDTLAGIMTGLLARGASPAHAAVWAVYVHGQAGLRLEKRIGRVGFLAREILDEIAPALQVASEDQAIAS